MPLIIHLENWLKTTFFLVNISPPPPTPPPIILVHEPVEFYKSMMPTILAKSSGEDSCGLNKWSWISIGGGNSISSASSSSLKSSNGGFCVTMVIGLSPDWSPCSWKDKFNFLLIVRNAKLWIYCNSDFHPTSI